ncbi:MAG: hypothetical protein LKF52_08635 [Butyrivibrio sp.]|jgi:hypothetical protein|nr:hypothetical protein [Butyrivibrio sp.]
MDKTTKVWLLAPNLICVCIDEFENGDFSGRLIESYTDEEQFFDGSVDMLLQMDELYDRWNYPQSSTRSRSFTKKLINVMPANIRKGDICMNIKKMQESRGKRGTFIVQVQYRQNSTWQGQVVWAEENRKEYFRSALELMKLIDGAMNSQEEADDNAL